MSALRDIPEIAGLDGRQGMVRIPAELDVPLTERVRAIIDTADFRRLAHVSQLGLVSLVYPAAIHTRFEHSLGVYRLALLFLRQLSYDPRFAAALTPADAELFLVAALLHDLGHWPFCHPIEDMRLPSVPQHELFANSFLLEGEIADALRDDWAIQPRDVVALLSGKPRDAKARLLASMLSGPDRHRQDGLPGPRQPARRRPLRPQLRPAAADRQPVPERGRRRPGHHRQGQDGRRDDGLRPLRDVQRSLLAPRRAGRHGHAAAGVLPAARHARSRRPVPPDRRSDDRRAATRPPVRGPPRDLLDGLFGPHRRLYKRLAQYSFFEEPELYQRLARRGYPWLAACAEHFAHLASTALGRIVAPHEILFDAPPVEREVEFNVDIYFPKEDRYRPLGEVSPVVRTLARTQFDDYVKRVRIFAHPRIVEDLRRVAKFQDVLSAAIDRTE